jgi:hypothetical protein
MQDVCARSRGMALGWSFELWSSRCRATDDTAESGHIWDIKDSPQKLYTDVRRGRAGSYGPVLWVAVGLREIMCWRTPVLSQCLW